MIINSLEVTSRSATEITLGDWIGMILAGLVSLTLITLIAVTWQFLRSPQRVYESSDHHLEQKPRVTILKPLKGLEHELDRNLRAFVDLQGPSYEVLFGIADPTDPAVAVVEQLIADHPQAPFSLFFTEAIPGRNPKMINLMGLEPRIRGELVLISDANTRPHPDSLCRLVQAFKQPSVGYGCAPFVVRGSQTVGAKLRSLHIGIQLVSWICGIYQLVGVAPIMGKWMVFRRQALRDMGGFAELSQYLAADGLTGKLLSPFGWQGAIIPDLIEISLGTWTVAEAWSQLLRWARLIRFLHPLGPLNLLIWNGTFWCLMGGVWWSLGFPLGGLALLSTGVLGWGLNGLAYWQRGGPIRDLVWLFQLDLQQLSAIIGAYSNNTIQWRDREFQVSQDARILD